MAKPPPGQFDSARPWTPKPGETPPPAPQITLEQLGERLDGQRRWERRETIRRALLMLLMSFVGGMIGSAFTIYLLT